MIPGLFHVKNEKKKIEPNEPPMQAVHSALSNCICIHGNVQFLEIALKNKTTTKTVC